MKAPHKHVMLPELSGHAIAVALVGVGGTGSHMLSGLARIHIDLLASGHPFGLNVTAYDPDKVTAANVGRQLFYQGDLGKSKARLLIARINQAFNLEWSAVAEPFEKRNSYFTPSIVIGCVDTREARRSIIKEMSGRSGFYYLDCGNGADYGQALIGCEPGKGAPKSCTRLPMPQVLCPELTAEGPEDDTPSCSLVEALAKQNMFINQRVATSALILLQSLLKNGGLDYQGVFVNTNPMSETALPIAPEKKGKRK